MWQPGLLTPWTALGVSRAGTGPIAEYPATPLGARILDLSTDVGLGAAFATTSDRSGVFTSPDELVEHDVPMQVALSAASACILDDARAAPTKVGTRSRARQTSWCASSITRSGD